MRLGLLARADNTGLGTQTWEAYRHLAPDKTMVIDYALMRGLQTYPQRFGDALVVAGAPTGREARSWLDGLDVVFICETPYTFHLLDLAREMGVRTIVQANYEFAPWMNNRNLPRPDVFALPTGWHYDDFPEPKILLPVPIATDRFDGMVVPADRMTARRFMHVVGTPAAHDRNGTDLLFEALAYVTSQIVVTVFCQRKGYVEQMIQRRRLPRNVTVVHNATQPEFYWKMYENQDCLIMPRRYGGLSLPVNEALGASMPVIMPDIEPNRDWLPANWLVPARRQPEEVVVGRAGNAVAIYDTDVRALAVKIDEFATSPSAYDVARSHAMKLRYKYSWQNISNLYTDTFATTIMA